MKCHICDYTYHSVADDFFQCPRCGHGFRTYEGDPIAYHENFYRLHFRRDRKEFDPDGAPNKTFHKARRKIVKKRFKLIKKYLDKSFECLDIGAGGGTFCMEIKNKVSRIDCTEVDENLLEECGRLGFPTRRGDFLTMNFDRGYDIVFAWHVAEHIIEVVEFIEKAISLSRKYFILEIPCNRRRPKLFDGHYHYFSMTSFRLALGESRIINVSEGVQRPALIAIVKGGGK